MDEVTNEKQNQDMNEKTLNLNLLNASQNEGMEKLGIIYLMRNATMGIMRMAMGEVKDELLKMVGNVIKVNHLNETEYEVMEK